jgi:hypothetical protein
VIRRQDRRRVAACHSTATQAMLSSLAPAGAVLVDLGAGEFPPAHQRHGGGIVTAPSQAAVPLQELSALAGMATIARKSWRIP